MSCPNCSARYRLSASAITAPTRMRCAACDHRWVAEVETAPVAAPPVAEPTSSVNVPPPAAMKADVPPRAAPAVDVPPPAAPEVDAPAQDDSRSGGSTLFRSLAALFIGGALAIAAAALWVARIDPADVPVLGDRIAAFAPRPLPLKVSFTARTSELPSGDRLLEITGAIKNTGTATIALPDLEARLATPAATARRWRIAAPVANLAPGASTPFTSTATGFPADATIVAIRPAR